MDRRVFLGILASSSLGVVVPGGEGTASASEKPAGSGGSRGPSGSPGIVEVSALSDIQMLRETDPVRSLEGMGPPVYLFACVHVTEQDLEVEQWVRMKALSPELRVDIRGELQGKSKTRVEGSDRELLERLYRELRAERCLYCSKELETIQWFSDWDSDGAGSGDCCDDCLPGIRAEHEARGKYFEFRDRHNAELIRQVRARLGRGPG